MQYCLLNLLCNYINTGKSRLTLKDTLLEIIDGYL